MASYREAEAGGVGAIGRDGRLVDAAHMRLAANTLHKASLAGVPGQPSGDTGAWDQPAAGRRGNLVCCGVSEDRVQFSHDRSRSALVQMTKSD